MKRILVTINKDIAMDPSTTFGGLVRVCNESASARFVHSNGENYDFEKGLVRTMDFVCESFIDRGFEKPKSDLWIFYSDGYQTNWRALGFRKPTDYHEKLMTFLEQQVSKGNVGEVINPPSAERRTLKSYLASLDSKFWGTIPTYQFRNFGELHRKFLERGPLVAKPNWGGGMRGISLIRNGEDLEEFKDLDISDLVFQDYHPGVEKRMWIAGGRFVEGRIIRGRDTPWMTHKEDSFVRAYNQTTIRAENLGIDPKEFSRDVETTERIARETGLLIGSVDFLGNKVNELNGAGTGYTSSSRSEDVRIDARHHLYKYIKSLLENGRRK